MEQPRPIQNLIDQANRINGTKPDRVFNTEVMIITPVKQIPMILPSGFATRSDFANKHVDDHRVVGQLQPGVYLNEVLPHKTNLFIEVVRRQGYEQVVKRYRAIPLEDADPEILGNNSGFADLAAKDDINITTVYFQLLETGYAILRNKQVADIHVMAKLDDVIRTHFDEYGAQLPENGPDSYKGVDVEYPFDNSRVFKQVVIPAAVPLFQLPDWIQKHDEFGFYSTGLSAYYRKGQVFVRPLFKRGRYTTARRVLDIYRLPENVFPTLTHSYFVQGKTITVLSTGASESTSGEDIDRLNEGSGARIISSDSVSLDTGYYYSKGQALTTRGDSLSEFKTSNRASGEELIPYLSTPTSNLCRQLTKNAYRDGIEVKVPWHNSDKELIEPCMSVRYFYMSGSDKMVYKEGTVLAIQSEDQKESQGLDIKFREHSVLTLFLSKEEQVAI